MGVTRIIQGDDKKIELTYKIGAVAQNISTCSNIKAELIIGGQSQKVYALTPSNSNEGTLELKTNGNDGIFNIFIEREESLLFAIGNGFFNVLFNFPDVTFPDGTRIVSAVFHNMQGEKGYSLNLDIE